MESTPSPRYKWVALSIVTTGAFMVAIDSTVVIIALPDIISDLHASLLAAVWVIMSYIFISTVLLLALGRVADIYGRVRLYNLGFIVFTVGSALCGLSPGAWELVAARVIQGGGGALMLVNSWAIVTETFPPNQRGLALGINSLTFGVGGIVGPVLGGFILAIASWRWVFLINIPIGIAVTILAYRYLRQRPPAPGPCDTLDLVGTVLFTLSLLALLVALMGGIQVGYGTAWVIALFVGAGVGMLLFYLWQRHVACPALDLRLFANRGFDFAVLAATLQALGIFAVQFLIVFYLQAVRGYSPLHAAVLLLPMPIALAVVGPLSGRLSDRIGARLPATAGLLIQAFGIWWLSRTTAHSSYLQLAVGLALAGIGGGLFFSPNTSAVMGSAPPERLGVASAVLATLRNTGMVTSYALSLAVAAASIPREIMLRLFVATEAHLGTALAGAFVHGMRAALHVSAGICVAAALMSLVRGPERRR